MSGACSISVLLILAFTAALARAGQPRFEADGAILGRLAELGAMNADTYDKLDRLASAVDPGSVETTWYCDCLMPRTLSGDSLTFDPSSVVGFSCMIQGRGSDIMYNADNLTVIPSPIGSEGHLFMGLPPGEAPHYAESDFGLYRHLSLNGERHARVTGYGAGFRLANSRHITARFGPGTGGLCTLTVPGMPLPPDERLTIDGGFHLVEQNFGSGQFTLWRPILSQYVPARRRAPALTYNTYRDDYPYSASFVLSSGDSSLRNLALAQMEPFRFAVTADLLASYPYPFKLDSVTTSLFNGVVVSVKLFQYDVLSSFTAIASTSSWPNVTSLLKGVVAAGTVRQPFSVFINRIASSVTVATGFAFNHSTLHSGNAMNSFCVTDGLTLSVQPDGISVSLGAVGQLSQADNLAYTCFTVNATKPVRAPPVTPAPVNETASPPDVLGSSQGSGSLNA